MPLLDSLPTRVPRGSFSLLKFPLPRSSKSEQLTIRSTIYCGSETEHYDVLSHRHVAKYNQAPVLSNRRDSQSQACVGCPTKGDET